MAMNKILYILPALAVLCMVPVGFTSAQTDTIPSWVKGIAGFWAEDNISESEFVNAIEFLIDNGIITVNQQEENNQYVRELEAENQRLRHELQSSSVPDITHPEATNVKKTLNLELGEGSYFYNIDSSTTHIEITVHNNKYRETSLEIHAVLFDGHSYMGASIQQAVPPYGETTTLSWRYDSPRFVEGETIHIDIHVNDKRNFTTLETTGHTITITEESNQEPPVTNPWPRPDRNQETQDRIRTGQQNGNIQHVQEPEATIEQPIDVIPSSSTQVIPSSSTQSYTNPGGQGVNEYHVEILDAYPDYKYQPDRLEVERGSKITIHNKQSASTIHNLHVITYDRAREQNQNHYNFVYPIKAGDAYTITAGEKAFPTGIANNDIDGYTLHSYLENFDNYVLSNRWDYNEFASANPDRPDPMIVIRIIDDPVFTIHEGKFHSNRGSPVLGKAQVIPHPDGGQTLKLDGFFMHDRVRPYHLYLATEKLAYEFVSLGELKTNNGDQEYGLPDDIDFYKYRMVLVWDPRDGHTEGYAVLTYPPHG